MKQVIINLVRNAAQALPERDGKVSVTVGRSAEWAVIAVTDNGCGIADEDLKRIWLPFFTTKKGTGMGLGLDTSKRIVEQHSGRIDCSSRVGQGTTMAIYLPLKR
jgi:signal transduction histidine kinase